MSVSRTIGKSLLGAGYIAANVAMYKIGRSYPHGLFGTTASAADLKKEMEYLKDIEKMVFLAFFFDPRLLKLLALLFPINVYQIGRHISLVEEEQINTEVNSNTPRI